MTLKGSRTVATGGVEKQAFGYCALHRPTQEPEAAQTFRDVLRQHAPELGDEVMTYAQELLEKGRLEERVRVIESLLREGLDWAAIERVMGVNETQFQALKQQVEDTNE
jgi:hypothetical protein